MAQESITGDASATKIQVSGDYTLTTRRRRADDKARCPKCRRTMRRTSIYRHLDRWHPETPIPALEVEGKVVVRSKLTYTALRCAACKEIIPAGTPQSTLLPGRRRTDWAHAVCPAVRSSPAEGASPPPHPTQKQPPTLTLLGLGGDPTPTPPRDGDPPATPGDAIIPAATILELGIVRASAVGREVHLEVQGDPNIVLSRLIGGDLVVCATCRDVLGERVSLPRQHVQEHDLTVHLDLWKRGRVIAESKAIEERRRVRGDRPAPLHQLPPG
jgi:hypothetical protein